MENRRPSFYAIIALASVIVIIAGLRAAKTLLLPFLFAIVLSIVVLPIVFWLEKRRIPRGLAIAITVIGVLGTVVLIGTITGQSLREFSRILPQYQETVGLQYQALLDWTQAQGVDTEALRLGENFDPGSVMNIIGIVLNSLVDVFSDTLLVTVVMAFILAEASAFPDKLSRAFPDQTESAFDGVTQLADSVQRYLMLKSLTSGLTGILVGAWTLALGLDFFVLWGFLAFVLNYIPTIGSIVAAIPAVLLASVQFGPGFAALVVSGYLVVNVAIGNILEPRLMGEQLGLSPMVVFLSLVFWGWLWGPAGMLLSVPLTVVLRSLLIHREETRWLAILLGPNRPAPRSADPSG
ncbi:MAG: AI-2 transport protein TqsA [Myxococcota bacterium]|jgi:AI-2 transport protein TqsA